MTDIPRGIRNNNPGNLELDGTDWIGLSPEQTDRPYAQFTEPKYGIRAIARDLKTMYRQGLKTIEEVITRWAPPSENDTEAYIAAVCADCGVQRDQVVDFSQPPLLVQLVAAIIKHENGEQPYPPLLLNYGVALA